MDTLEDILDAHAEGLNVGRDLSQLLLDRHESLFPKLAKLLFIAKRLHAVLVPRQAPADFVVLLRNDLKAFDEQPYLEPVQTRRPATPWVIVGSLAGTVAGVIGIIVWIRRRAGRELATDASTALPS